MREEKGELPSISRTITILENAAAQNYGALNKIVERLTLVSNALQSAGRRLSVLCTKQGRNSDKSETFLPEVANSEFTKMFESLIEQHVNPRETVQGCSALFVQFQQDWSEFGLEYKNKADFIFNRFKSSFTTLNDADDRASSLHKSYIKAGVAVKEAYSHNSSKLKDLQEHFVRAQKDAFDAYQQSNLIRNDVSTVFDRTLTDFEHLQRWMFIRVRALLSGFADSIREHLGTAYLAESNRVIQFCQLQPDCDAKLFEDTSFMKSAMASPKMQGIPVPVIASKFLDPKLMYGAEIDAGGVVYHVMEDFRGGPNELDVNREEVVVAIEAQGDFVMCKNVNECVGLVPVRILQRYRGIGGVRR
jgi:hypothetical protein